jgi:ABC-type molybdenum transport system ATPase subunit/photorepair protein PhrA
MGPNGAGKSSLIKSLIGEFNGLLYNNLVPVALNSPIKDLIREDLPAPFGPMIPIISPRTGID